MGDLNTLAKPGLIQRNIRTHSTILVSAKTFALQVWRCLEANATVSINHTESFVITNGSMRHGNTLFQQRALVSLGVVVRFISRTAPLCISKWYYFNKEPWCPLVWLIINRIKVLGSAVLPYINGGLHLGVLVLPLFQRRALVSWRYSLLQLLGTAS